MYNYLLTFILNHYLIIIVKISVLHIICVLFTYYTTYIIYNNFFNNDYIQNYSDGPLTNKNRILPISKQLQ